MCAVCDGRSCDAGGNGGNCLVQADGGCACVLEVTPSATFTPTPTPTSQAGICVGDCNDDGAVSIDELILGVNIALGSAAVSACPSLPCENNLGVFVNCLVIAVNNALFGCSGPPTPTPAPQCSTVPCGGSCAISAPCTPGPDTACPNFVVLGVCELNPLNGCQCEPVQLVTPTPGPTPVLYHGHTCCECDNDACSDFAWLEVEHLCPVGCQTFRDAECEAPCHPGPSSGPSTCVLLTPCTSDADCDDGNGCTADHCTMDGCTHASVCV